jgi:hypothetical protein
VICAIVHGMGLIQLQFCPLLTNTGVQFDDLEWCAVYLPAVEVSSKWARVDYLLKGVVDCNDVQFKSIIAMIQSQEDDENVL